MHFSKSYFDLSQMVWCTIILVFLSLVNCHGHDEVGSEDIDNVHSEHAAHSRQKRFVYFNTQSPVDIGLLITVPLSFALPTFNLRTSRRFKKSISAENEAMANLTAEDVLPSDSFDEPAYTTELTKMTTYFTILEVEEDICQQRIICEVFAEPDKYKPVSDIFERKLTVDRGPMSEKYSSRYYRYVHAMHEGMSGGEPACLKEYKRCPYSTQERLNMPALHFWTYLINILRMEFRDE